MRHDLGGKCCIYHRVYNSTMIRWRIGILLTLMSVLCTSYSLSSQTIADWDWVNGHFGEALDHVMPLEKSPGYYVVYRAHRDYRTDVPEY